MAKRTILNSDALGSPSSKRTKKAHERDEVEVFDDVPSGSSTTTKENSTCDDENSASETSAEPEPTPSSRQQQENEESKETQRCDPKSPTPEPDHSKPPQKSLRSRSSFIPIPEPPPMTWLSVPDPKDNKYTYKHLRRQPLAPAPEAKSKPVVPTKQTKRKISRPERDFTVFEDATATADSITELEDEYFGVAIDEAHDWVESYCQQAAFDYGIRIVDWALVLGKTACEGRAERDGSTLEKRLNKWKKDIKWEWRAAKLRRQLKTGRVWFKAEYVEGLADLFEETLSVLNLEVVEIKLASQDEIVELEYMTYKVCGYCHGKGLYGSKWPTKVLLSGGDEDHYERSGRAWKRIVDYFAGDLWETSQYIVTEWHWHNKMMRRVLRSGNKMQHIDLLRTRWAAKSNHPLAPTRRPLGNISEATVNGLQKDEGDEGYLEDGVWIE